MKAAVRSKYGPPEILRIEELDIPVPQNNEILVRIYATTVNRTDCGVLRGKPFPIRFFTGLFKPKAMITGVDFAGQVEATGNDVTLFKKGDRVMGIGSTMKTGTHAEYRAFSENNPIIVIPGNISYEQATASLEGAFYAFNTISKIKPGAGQKALVIGGTGAIGSALIQLLKYYEVDITAVCSGEYKKLVASLGAGKVIDRHTEDFTTQGGGYDFAIDAVGKSSFSICKPLLKKKGVYISSDGIENIFLALITPLLGRKKVLFGIPKNSKGFLIFIKKLIEEGKFTPVIDRKYPLEQIAEAYAYVATEQKIGNVVLTL